MAQTSGVGCGMKLRSQALIERAVRFHWSKDRHLKEGLLQGQGKHEASATRWHILGPDRSTVRLDDGAHNR